MDIRHQFMSLELTRNVFVDLAAMFLWASCLCQRFYADPYMENRFRQVSRDCYNSYQQDYRQELPKV
jgi:hypothetical protein